jgi:signal transduction histidine kinase/DNA-binding response OmpR family regulator
MGALAPVTATIRLRTSLLVMLFQYPLAVSRHQSPHLPSNGAHRVLDWAARERPPSKGALLDSPTPNSPIANSVVSPAVAERDRSEYMTESFDAQEEPTVDLSAVGSNGASMRAVYDQVDWSATPLGTRDTWPALLRLLVDLCLDSEFPVQISWGPDLLVLYNDAYIPLLGADKHPWALGRPASEVDPHLWPASEEHLHEVMQTGRAYHSDDQQLIINRHGYPEEAHFTFSVSAIRDADGTIVGLFNAITESTQHILYERRLQVLRRLGTLSITGDDSLASTCRAAVEVIGKNRKSVPFAAVFLAEGPNRSPQRVAGYGFDEAVASACELVAATPLNGPVLEVLEHGGTVLMSGLRERYPGLFAPGPLGPLPPDQAFVLPVAMLGRREPIGALVLGINPYWRPDDAYTAFAAMAARQLGVIITDAVSYQNERRRQQALEELDRARTEFFQNVTHELRAPLTMLLTPLQDILDEPGVVLSAAARDTVETSVRAGDRLQRVVDALLDISRAESGGPLVPDREEIDLASVTADVVEGFRPAAEDRLNLRLYLPPEPLRAYVDRTMWTTIVTNLVSNALKYTPQGDVSVSLTGDDSHVVLTVADTGVGIPLDEQAHIFERFHRVAGDQQPGSGIGLALVADMTAAHGGSVAVASEPGQGSQFVVRLPRYNGSSVAASLAEDATAPLATDEASPDRPRLLIIEDEPDLRGYLVRLFTKDGYAAEAAADAETALSWLQEHADDPPDMVITDVMLPGQSGLDVLSLIRQDPGIARLPVVVLTARAEAESAVEAFAAGADDFVSKPFNSAELLARVRAHYQMNQLRDLAVDAAQTTVGQLRQALKTNRTTGTAVGIVMTRYDLDPARAFQVLVRTSQQTNRKLHDIAEELVRTGVLPGVTSPVVTPEPRH